MIFAVIIGTEILNGRRDDSHFTFLRDKLIQKGYELSGSFIIKDEPELMQKTFNMIKEIPNSKMFCFGGIGATPDDYTRKLSAEVFANNQMEFNEEFRKLIDTKFPNEDNTKKYNLAYWPINANPIRNNPINGFFGFEIEKRFFFMPGFPQMAHPMVEEVLDKYFPPLAKKERYSLLAYAKESDMLDIMNALPKEIEFSTLPKLDYTSEISIAGDEAKKWIEFFKKELEKKGIKYKPIS
jgi:molybdopterin-biosynthesis enzyme MoeA-like protein